MARYLDISGGLPDGVRHWYLCGPDEGLLQGAYMEIRQHAGKSTSEVELLDGSECSFIELEEVLRSTPIAGGDPVLVVLMNADQVNLHDLAKRRVSDYPAWLIAVGGSQVPSGDDPDFAYFIKRQAAKVVSCKRPDRTKLIRWASQRLGCAGDVAHALVEESGGDTAWLSHELHKLARLGVGPLLASGHIPRVTSGGAGGSLVDALLLERKGTALSCIPDKTSSPAVFRSLELMTVKGALVYEAQKNAGWSKRVLLERTGLSTAELDMLRSHINVFGRIPTERRLRVLAKVAERAVRGERAAWQTLIALW